MNYGFKITTHGRALLAACMDLDEALNITRVAVGSGRVSEDANLADVHKLVRYMAEGMVADRRREGDRLYLTVQYSNQNSPDTETFQLREFLVYARHPDTGAETDLLYATLGDYPQSIPAYRPDFPPGLWIFPLTIVVSSELEVNVSASPGLVTAEEFTEALARQKADFDTALTAHNADLTAHTLRRHVIATRVRDPARPAYGLKPGGGGEAEVLLAAGPYTGTAEVSAVVSGAEYDAQNMRVGEDVPNGTLILTKLEE